MGLDQKAFAVTPEVAHLVHITERELTDEEMNALSDGTVSITHWRKHADLNKWMEDLYVRKGGMDVFNLIPLKIERDDLMALRMHLQVNGNAYAERGQGFFWGESRHEDILNDHTFIDKALKMLDEGYEVYYSCWW
jgi:hypothetical protein